MSYKIEVDMDACSGCGTCYEVCPSECFGEVENGKTVIIAANTSSIVGKILFITISRISSF